MDDKVSAGQPLSTSTFLLQPFLKHEGKKPKVSNLG